MTEIQVKPISREHPQKLEGVTKAPISVACSLLACLVPQPLEYAFYSSGH